MVDDRIGGGQVLDLAELIEGKELSSGRGTAGVHPGFAVQDERVGGLVVLGKIQGAVVIVVALIVDLQQVPHAGIGCLSGIGLGGIEQIVQRLAVLAQHRVAVLQQVLHNARVGPGTAGIVVDGIGLVVGSFKEPQQMPGVDALVQIGRVDIVGLKLSGDPVVEQVDGSAHRRDGIGQNGGRRQRKRRVFGGGRGRSSGRDPQQQAGGLHPGRQRVSLRQCGGQPAGPGLLGWVNLREVPGDNERLLDALGCANPGRRLPGAGPLQLRRDACGQLRRKGLSAVGRQLPGLVGCVINQALRVGPGPAGHLPVPRLRRGGGLLCGGHVGR